MSKNGKSHTTDPEAEFLAEQSKAARQAIGTVIKEIEGNLARSADVRAWAARYPWRTVAAATAAGFGAGIAAAAIVHPKKSDSNGHADSDEQVDCAKRGRRNEAAAGYVRKAIGKTSRRSPLARRRPGRRSRRSPLRRHPQAA